MDNCFALGRQCSILKKTECQGCSFMKSKEEYINSKRKSYNRLASLPEVRQDYISDKYYSSRKPWLTGGEDYAI